MEMTNTCNSFAHLKYLIYRQKLKISLEDLENDDSSSDGEWKEKNFTKAKRHRLSRLDGKTFQKSSLSETEPKTRVLPRRAVTLNKKRVIDSGEVDSEFDSEHNE